MENKRVNIDDKPIAIKNSLIHDKTAAEWMIGLLQADNHR